MFALPARQPFAITIPIRSPPSQSQRQFQSQREEIRSPKSSASPFDPLSAALATAQAKYALANAKSLAAHNEACGSLPGGNTRTVLHASPFPITFVHGEGCDLTSLDGEKYVDFLSEFTAGIYGHSHPAISAAITEALSSGWNFGGPNCYERSLAAKVCKRFAPSGIELVRFTNSGTEANTMAIAAAVAFTGRKKVLVFRNGYHGGTLSFPANLNENCNTNLPHEFIVAPYNDIEGTKAQLATLPKDSLAAVMVELVQGSGGAIPGTDEFLKFLDMAAHSMGALFIIDEVMTSRLAYHGLTATLGLNPDLVTLGKWIGGGMTFGAFGGKKNGGVMNLFDPRGGILSHSGTFNNNIVTMAAGDTGIDLVTEEHIQRLNSLGDFIKESIGRILEMHGIFPSSTTNSTQPCLEKNELESPFTGISPPTVTPLAGSIESLTTTAAKPSMWVSGRGSMLGIHFSGESEGSLKSLFWHHLLEDGIYIAQRGFISLNMSIQEAHAQKLVNSVEAFVGRYRQALCCREWNN
ncbi:putative acetylornithine aminotransferase-2 [Coleophoma cylindrospora]|uniref:Putative acetylornithine aminotransferase-2 n=1 Tax=Coleophoma cylindrospora TaxID=1849047 RepID=A0A3D8S8N6_9HELO|nr:putative acetylornithine aminotransferase-2 [Coleophoma cylindrospora]